MGRPEALGWRVLAAGALGLLVAGADPIPVGEEYAGRIREERARLDERTRAGEVTPFTPVATRMLAPGEWVEVAVCGEEVRFVAEDGCRPAVRLRYTGAAFQQAGADGGASEVGARLELGRFRLALSPQGDSGRVQVHDPGAEAQRAFDGYRWYAPDPAYRFQVEVEPYEEQEPIRMATTTGLAKTSRRVRLRVERTAEAVEDRVIELETLLDIVQTEVEDTVLDVAAVLRSTRRGAGILRSLRKAISRKKG